MVAEQSYEPRQLQVTLGARLRTTGITHGAELRFIAVNDGPGEVGSPPRCDQDEKRWFQNSSPLPESLVLGKRDLNS